MKYGLLVAAEVIEILERLQLARRRLIWNRFRQIAESPRR
jgi:hypothetical protein